MDHETCGHHVESLQRLFRNVVDRPGWRSFLSQRSDVGTFSRHHDLRHIFAHVLSSGILSNLNGLFETAIVRVIRRTKGAGAGILKAASVGYVRKQESFSGSSDPMEPRPRGRQCHGFLPERSRRLMLDCEVEGSSGYMFVT